MFDLVVCRAAFKNFSEPLKALNETHRVPKPGGKAIIIDLRMDASWEEVVAYVGWTAHQPGEHVDDEVHVQALAAEASLHGSADGVPRR